MAEPDGAARGGIVVLQEARGVTDSIRLLVTGLAADGWLAVAPHLYRDADAGGDLADGSEAAVAEHVGSLDPRQVMDDCDTAFGWLGDQGFEADRMGVLGFDLGGTVALHVAANRTLGAAITVAGSGIESSPWSSLPALVETAPELTCPWLGIYPRRRTPTPSPGCATPPRPRGRRPTSSSTRAPATASTTTRSRPPRRGSGSSTGSTRTCADERPGPRGHPGDDRGPPRVVGVRECAAGQEQVVERAETARTTAAGSVPSGTSPRVTASVTHGSQAAVRAS